MELTIELIESGSDYLADKSIGVRKRVAPDQHLTADSGGNADDEQKGITYVYVLRSFVVLRIYFRDRHSDYQGWYEAQRCFSGRYVPYDYLQGRTHASPLSLVQRAVTRFRREGCGDRSRSSPAESLRHSYSELAEIGGSSCGH